MFLSLFSLRDQFGAKHRRNTLRASRHRRRGLPGAQERLEGRTLLAVSILNGGGLGYAGTDDGSDPPDTCGAAGPSSYIEAINGTITIFAPKLTGAVEATHGINDFFYNPSIGNETKIDAGTFVPIAASPTGATEAGTTVTITTSVAHGFSTGQTVTISGVGVAGYNGSFPITGVTPTTFTYTDPTSGLANSGGGTASVDGGSCGTCDSTIVFDNLMGTNGRFIIGDIDVDTVANVSQYIFAVSKSDNPTTLTTADWNFYHFTTTEGSGTSTSWSDFPGNPGYNSDAFVETFNMFGAGPTGCQVVSVSASDLANGVSQASLHVYHNDVPGGAQNYRPVTMQDAVAGDPMWLIHNPDDGSTLDVVKMTNVLSSSASFSTTSLSLPAADQYTPLPVSPQNPDASLLQSDADDQLDGAPGDTTNSSSKIDDRILKASEFNNAIVATDSIPFGTASVAAATLQLNSMMVPIGGSGYSVGDTLTVSGGTFTTAATLTVATLGAGGSVASVTVANPGIYSNTAGITGAVTGGTGTGAKFNFRFSGERDVEWFAIDVSSGTPAFQLDGGVPNVGRIGFGPNTYAYYPGIDINSMGQIGLSFMESDTVGGAVDSATKGFVSTFVTARMPTDPAGTMDAPVLVAAGTGSGDIVDRAGDFSGMNIDPVNGTFWGTNQFGNGGNPANVIVNFTPNAPPTVMPPTAPQTSVEGASQLFSLGSFADPSGGPWTVDVSWGDGTADTVFTATAPGPITPQNHTYTEEGVYTGTITVTDTADGQFDSELFSVIVADAQLTAGAATLLTPHTGVALPGSTIVATFTDANAFATIADYTTIIDWGDGSPESTGVVVATATPGVFDIEGGHTYAKPGVFTTLVTVHDDGGSEVVVTGSATVTDLAVSGAADNFTSVEGQSTGVFVLATFTDPNTLATVADVSAVLSVSGWGDSMPTGAGVPLVVQEIGVTPLTSATNPGAPIFEVLGSHTYKEETPAATPDPLSVIVTTLGGVSTTISSPAGDGVTILDAPLSGSNGPEITGIEGITTGTVVLGTFTDANQFATVADYSSGGGSVVVNWGDGSAPQILPASDLTPNGRSDGITWTLSAAHTYAEEGTYAYSVTVTDDGGATTAFVGSAIIADAKLTSSAIQPTVSTVEASIFPIPVFEPPLFNGPVASFIDADPTSTIADFKATIDWGDSTGLTAGTVTQPLGVGTAYIVSGSHTYADSGVSTGSATSGTYKIQVFVVDEGGSVLTVDNTAAVADNSIVLTGELNPTSDSGLSTGTVNTTNITQPDFLGKSEPLSTVTLSATLLPSGTPFIIGQVEAGSDGSWNIESEVPLADGHYAITATAIDQFGQTIVTTPPSPVVITSDLLIDTKGPVIDGMFFNRLNGQIDYIIKDPGSTPSGVWLPSILDSANYELTKVHAYKAYPGKWIVTNVTATPDPTIANAFDVAVTINGGGIIRGGFYLFTVRDTSSGNSSVQDRAENHLDGEFYGKFPSGNGVNGGDFVAELQAYHNKVFAPQTIIGTAFAGNGGHGGRRVAPVHSGIWVPVVRRGSSPIFSTSTSPSDDADPPASKGHSTHKAKRHSAVRARHHNVGSTKHNAVLNANHGESVRSAGGDPHANKGHSTHMAKGHDVVRAKDHIVGTARHHIVVKTDHGESIYSARASHARQEALVLGRSHPKGPNRP
jgi:hypothetical protein